MKNWSILCALLLLLPCYGLAQRKNALPNYEVEKQLEKRYNARVYSCGYYLGLFRIERRVSDEPGQKGQRVGLAENDGTILIEPDRYNELQIGYADVFNRGYYPFVIAWEERKISVISLDGHVLASGIKGEVYKGTNGERYLLRGSIDYDPITGFTLRGKRLKTTGWIDVNGHYTPTRPQTEDPAVTQRLKTQFASVAYDPKTHSYRLDAKGCAISGLADRTGRVIVPPSDEEIYPDLDCYKASYARLYANEYVQVRRYAYHFNMTTKQAEDRMEVVEWYDLQGALLVPAWAGFGSIQLEYNHGMWYFSGRNQAAYSSGRATNDPNYMGVWSLDGQELVPRLYEEIDLEKDGGVLYFECRPKKYVDECAIYDLNGVMLIAPYYGSPYYSTARGFSSSEYGDFNIFLTEQHTLDQARSGPLALSIPDAYWERQAAREERQEAERAKEEQRARAAEAERQRRNEARLQLIAALSNMAGNVANAVNGYQATQSITSSATARSGNTYTAATSSATASSSGVSANAGTEIRRWMNSYDNWCKRSAGWVVTFYEEQGWFKAFEKNRTAYSNVELSAHQRRRSDAQKQVASCLEQMRNCRKMVEHHGGQIPKSKAEAQAEVCAGERF